MKVDILAVGVHPNDVELCCAGTLLGELHRGRTVGILDLTAGELGTNGDGETRLQEAERSRQILGASWRLNLGMADGFFTVDRQHILPIARVIRQCRPEVLLCNVPEDRHPDHGRAAQLVAEAAFYSGLSKIELADDEGTLLERWRPNVVLHYLQDHYHKPSVVYDITAHFEKKNEAIRSFSSQFQPPDSNVTLIPTPISGTDFWHFLEARAREMGRLIGCEYGEGFITEQPLRVKNLFDLV